MAGRARLLGLAGRAVAALLVLSSCAGGNTLTSATTTALTDRSAVPAARSVNPVVVDTDGAPLLAEHAQLVRSVYRALSERNLDALGELYAGDDWSAQADLLATPEVRRSVLDALRTHPSNLGEGYLYPGFTVNGWAGPVELADAARLGIDPATMPDPTVPDPEIGYPGYQTAFFLDYDPPQTAGGPLRWRGIALIAPVPNP